MGTRNLSLNAGSVHTKDCHEAIDDRATCQAYGMAAKFMRKGKLPPA
jgi:hypothetical protein